MNYSIDPIATIKTPFKEKFGTPRQPGLVPSAVATIDFHQGFANSEAIRGLEEFSHVWLIFAFHLNWEEGWSPTVRPPRLGGNTRVGVYATRSPFRPNPLGLSVVKIITVREEGAKISIDVEGPDLIDGTPIFDIKPYIAYSDAIPEAQSSFASVAPPQRLTIVFSEEAQEALEEARGSNPELEQLLVETLQLDPRPAYKQKGDDARDYWTLIGGYDIRWNADGDNLAVTKIVPQAAMKSS